jgi:hypothetical protein
MTSSFTFWLAACGMITACLWHDFCIWNTASVRHAVSLTVAFEMRKGSGNQHVERKFAKLRKKICSISWSLSDFVCLNTHEIGTLVHKELKSGGEQVEI